MEKINTRSAFVSIVGKPNVGKSSLLNMLTGQKIAIVTNRPQTTRTKITGILTKDEVQFVFIDTPGLHKPKTKLSEHMVKAVNQSIADVDIAVLVAEPVGEVTQAELNLIESFRAQRLPAILVLNKIDTLKNKDVLMERIQKFSSLYNFDHIIPLSALTGEGVDVLLQELDSYALESVHFFPDDTLTDQPERVIIAEIIREKLLLNMREEIPHGIAVTIERMKERSKGNMMDIEAVIYCERDNHKGMIIGKGGAMLKKIATDARLDIQNFLGCHVNLQCWVKVKEDWRNREGLIRTFGLSQQ
ncbi:MAG TPA: GTPase Era [Firmicutes bacterium]|nr:GTPase Era [Bacillota bacterium]